MLILRFSTLTHNVHNECKQQCFNWIYGYFTEMYPIEILGKWEQWTMTPLNNDSLEYTHSFRYEQQMYLALVRALFWSKWRWFTVNLVLIFPTFTIAVIFGLIRVDVIKTITLLSTKCYRIINVFLVLLVCLIFSSSSSSSFSICS